MTRFYLQNNHTGFYVDIFLCEDRRPDLISKPWTSNYLTTFYYLVNLYIFYCLFLFFFFPMVTFVCSVNKLSYKLYYGWVLVALLFVFVAHLKTMRVN
jgi:hypothetical protein